MRIACSHIPVAVAKFPEKLKQPTIRAFGLLASICNGKVKAKTLRPHRCGLRLGHQPDIPSSPQAYALETETIGRDDYAGVE